MEKIIIQIRSSNKSLVELLANTSQRDYYKHIDASLSKVNLPISSPLKCKSSVFIPKLT